MTTNSGTKRPEAPGRSNTGMTFVWLKPKENEGGLTGHVQKRRAGTTCWVPGLGLGTVNGRSPRGGRARGQQRPMTSDTAWTYGGRVGR